jgi:two-component system sensor histidine kinase/response regulator
MTSQDITQSFSPAILIVDDNSHNLQVLGKLLLESRYEIEFATNGEAALDWLNARKFDLILLDINMPGMSGFEVCTRIRSNSDLNNIPVIFLSAESERENILKGFELGAQDYITKPFDSRELLVRVRTHLVLKDSLEKLESLNRSLEEKVVERTQQLKEANENLETLNLKLLDLDKAKSEFLNLISHEIRTPLNGILGPLELLKDTVNTPDISDLVEILDMSVKRLEIFSLNALLITRLKTKPFSIRKGEIHLSNLIIEALNEEKDKLQSKNIQVKRKNNITKGLINGEAELIKKCICNILDNAIFFTPQNGIIEVNTFIEGQNIMCVINDNGPGFALEAINLVFELFAKGDACKDNCTGIGLPVAKMIMEAHGGSIIIENNSRGGASVKLQFQNAIME